MDGNDRPRLPRAVIAVPSASRASRADAEALDADDRLARLRDEFTLPEGVIYLDGNSLGALPRRTPQRLAAAIESEWGQGLIRSWNSAGWIDLAASVGDALAGWIGARPGEVSVGDSTSVNLFKALSAAAALQKADRPDRTTIVSERDNFPTDLYIAESVAAANGLRLELVETAALHDRLDDDVSLLMLTHVNYRSGRMHELAETTRAAHAAGALVVWDLAHSAGAVPVDLRGGSATGSGIEAAADFAVGCGYKYLNGGPGAPGFVWAHPRHTERMDREQLRQPLSGWLGHAAPFEFSPGYRPAPGIARFVCGTPPILSLAALACGLEVFGVAEAAGGMAALRAKSIALVELFIGRVESRCAGHGLTLASPRDSAVRGSQASFAHADAYPIMQATISRGVIGDFRAGDPAQQGAGGNLLRFGFAPLYNRFVDAWDAAEALAGVLESGAWREPGLARRAAVT